MLMLMSVRYPCTSASLTFHYSQFLLILSYAQTALMLNLVGNAIWKLLERLTLVFNFVLVFN